MFLNKKESIDLTVLIIARIILDLLYVLVLDFYKYDRYLLYIGKGAYSIDVNILKYIVSLLVFLLFSYYLVKHLSLSKKKASIYLIYGLYLVSFTPTLSYFGLANLEYSFLISLVFFWSLLFFFYKFFDKKTQDLSVLLPIKHLTSSRKEKIWLGILIFFSVGSIILYLYVNGFKFNFNLSDDLIYETRFRYKDLKLGMWIEYFRHNAMLIIIPIAAIFYLKKKNYVLFFLMVFIQLLLYGIDNQKVALLIIPMSLIIYIMFTLKSSYSYFNIYLTINVFILVEHYFTKASFLAKNILERFYYVPAFISYYYYDFFKSRQPVIPLVSFLKSIGLISNYPYDQGVPFIIGDTYFADPKMSANTGLFGSAFSYGILGIILIPIVYSCLFILLDKVTRGVETKLILPTIIILIFGIVGTTIFVVLTIYGYFLLLLVLYLLNENLNNTST